MSSSSFTDLNAKIISLKKELESKNREYNELTFLHESMLEHSTSLENQLQETNEKINHFLEQMKKYLSPQLYELITGSDREESISFQRKRLTVFFSDIVGFTDITDSFDPETLSECLNVYLDEMSKIAIKYGATIDKFIGDAIMIFFGAPNFYNNEKHALDCVLMSIEMINKLTDVNIYWKKAGISAPLQIRIGINTGFCTVGNFGSNERTDYTIVGGSVNLASRLEHEAEPGTVYISEATNSLIENKIKTKKVGDIHVKGINKPVSVYKVIGSRDDSRDFNPFINIKKDGFVLPHIDFSKKENSKEECEKIEQALVLALSKMKKTEPEKTNQVEN